MGGHIGGVTHVAIVCYLFCSAGAGRRAIPAGLGSKQDNWIRDTRSQLYRHLFFLETIRDAFNSDGFLSRALRKLHAEPGVLDHDQPDVVRTFEILRDARHQLELDTAAGWRRTVEARK